MNKSIKTNCSDCDRCLNPSITILYWENLPLCHRCFADRIRELPCDICKKNKATIFSNKSFICKNCANE